VKFFLLLCRQFSLWFRRIKTETNKTEIYETEKQTIAHRDSDMSHGMYGQTEDSTTHTCGYPEYPHRLGSEKIVYEGKIL